MTRSNNEDVQNLMKAVKQLTRYATRPVEAALVVDGKTMAKTIVKPMKKEMERIEKINNRLRGEDVYKRQLQYRASVPWQYRSSVCGS